MSEVTTPVTVPTMACALSHVAFFIGFPYFSSAAWVRSHPDRVVLGHCHNGNDRTGDFAGTLVLDQMTVSESHAYMVETGFHDALVGLLVQWRRYAESARP